MQHLFRTVAITLATGMFLSIAPFATAQNANANDNAFDATSKHSAPEIRAVAAGAVGILVVGGIALLTTRRRAHASKI